MHVTEFWNWLFFCQDIIVSIVIKRRDLIHRSSYYARNKEKNVAGFFICILGITWKALHCKSLLSIYAFSFNMEQIIADIKGTPKTNLIYTKLSSEILISILTHVTDCGYESALSVNIKKYNKGNYRYITSVGRELEEDPLCVMIKGKNVNYYHIRHFQLPSKFSAHRTCMIIVEKKSIVMLDQS
ncbi:hypothetical protein BDA99DRAFT_568463 [Phascolomyces articulosus]|uniref:Uncharacterized protein n=1 Tax=Phascolomyces articulosus TaxID=60185 RepID=A0AAD5KMC5_9FUNG|nr:hypothetical protein BDA99DRAFT_568463 [Phascolomyces articulosus]